MLAVCGGGSDAVALLVVALAVVAWIWVAVLVIKGARDRRERKVLIAVALVSCLVGPAILFGLLAGLSGDSTRLPEIVIGLLLPGLIGACVAVFRKAARAASAFLLALWGAVFLPGAYLILVISFLALGTGCLE